MGQCLTYCVAYNLRNLHLRQLYHLGAIICPRNFMPYLGVYLSLVTLKGHRFYCCLCLRTEIKPRNKNSSCLRDDNLSPLLDYRYNVSVIFRVGDFCVLRFYICVYRYGSSLSMYSTLRRILAAVSHTISFSCCILY